LNRFKLVVKGATGGRVKVTWGEVSREFSGAEAERGINLAAAFMDNPFSAQFLKVEEAVKNQQNFETPLVKRVMHELAEFQSIIPEEKSTMEQIKQTGMRKAKGLFEQAAKEVVPVRHTIRIEVIK
jgi:hypothetical protein